MINSTDYIGLHDAIEEKKILIFGTEEEAIKKASEIEGYTHTLQIQIKLCDVWIIGEIVNECGFEILKCPYSTDLDKYGNKILWFSEFYKE